MKKWGRNLAPPEAAVVSRLRTEAVSNLGAIALLGKPFPNDGQPPARRSTHDLPAQQGASKLRRRRVVRNVAQHALQLLAQAEFGIKPGPVRLCRFGNEARDSLDLEIHRANRSARRAAIARIPVVV